MIIHTQGQNFIGENRQHSYTRSDMEISDEQAGAELCQAQEKLGLAN